MTTCKGVYVLTSPSGKRYVGIGMGKYGVEARWRDYRAGRSVKQRGLHRAMLKYGPAAFKYEHILKTEDAERAKRVEKQLIALWNLRDPNRGYNITEGGDGCCGARPDLRGRSSGMAGKKHSALTKKRIGDAHRGVKRPRKPGTGGHGHRSVVRSDGAVFRSLSDAARALGRSAVHVWMQLTGRCRTVSGFSFRYMEVGSGVPAIPKKVKRSARLVDSTGAVYGDAAEAGKALGIDPHAIRAVARGIERRLMDFPFVFSNHVPVAQSH